MNKEELLRGIATKVRQTDGHKPDFQDKVHKHKSLIFLAFGVLFLIFMNPNLKDFEDYCESQSHHYKDKDEYLIKHDKYIRKSRRTYNFLIFSFYQMNESNLYDINVVKANYIGVLNTFFILQ